jgi:hypothetical protein
VSRGYWRAERLAWELACCGYARTRQWGPVLIGQAAIVGLAALGHELLVGLLAPVLAYAVWRELRLAAAGGAGRCLDDLLRGGRRIDLMPVASHE